MLLYRRILLRFLQMYYPGEIYFTLKVIFNVKETNDI